MDQRRKRPGILDNVPAYNAVPGYLGAFADAMRGDSVGDQLNSINAQQTQDGYRRFQLEQQEQQQQAAQARSAAQAAESRRRFEMQHGLAEQRLGLQRQQFAASQRRQDPSNVFKIRAAAARQYGVKPGSDEGRAFILTGNLPREAKANIFNQRHQAAAQYGFPEAHAFEPDQWLEHGDTVEAAGVTFDVVHAPGHTPGHVVFVQKDDKVAMVGDVLFQGSIGRTDFPKGNYQQLIDSITQRLWPLGPDITFIPGHGPTSTFGQEKQTNPFVSDTALG